MALLKMNGVMQKMMSAMIRPVENVSYDLATAQTGIKSSGGLTTFGFDDNGEPQLSQNPMEMFSMEVPAFAVLTPVEQVRVGDIIVSEGKAYGFVTQDGTRTQDDGEDVPRGQLTTLNIQGHVSRFVPKKVEMMGVQRGITVVRSMFNMMGNQNQGQQPQQGLGFGGGMEAMMPMLMMQGMMGESGKDDGNDMLKMMMLSQMMGGQQGGVGMGGMFSNPLMMMMMLGDEGGFKSPFG